MTPKKMRRKNRQAMKVATKAVAEQFGCTEKVANGIIREFRKMKEQDAALETSD